MGKPNILLFEKIVESLMNAEDINKLKHQRLSLEGSIEALYVEKINEMRKEKEA